MNNDIILDKPPLFFANYNSAKFIVVNQGGTSSGKTWAILDVIFILAILDEKSVTTIVGQDIPNLKVGAYRDAKRIYYDSDIYKRYINPPNETDRVFRCVNGSIIEFKSYENEQDAKSGKRDRLFINEANGIAYDIYWQLFIRTTKKIFIDYNPTCRFWVHEKVIGSDNVELIISDHRHNPYLDEKDHEKIESIPDPEKWKVYARGLTGKIEGLVYNNWDIVESMPITYKKRWIGLDFGFTNDPTAIIDVMLSEGDLWINEICYERGLTNPDINDRLKNLRLDSDISIVADSAEPKSIAEIRRMGTFIEAAIKGPDSIKAGIDILKRYRIKITRNSLNIIDEIGKYKWSVNSDGSTTNKPIDIYNHALDAIRYVALNKLISI